MEYAKTIALATDLLANGRAEDVVRMVEPLLEPMDATAPATGPALLHALMARVEVTHRGDVASALDRLQAFDDAPARSRLGRRARAEVTLWLGWAHALRHQRNREDARALTLLDEAERLFGDLPSPGGRCWCLLGKARAYFAIDEYHLMRLVLGEAEAVHAKTHDAQAGRWLHDLSVPACRFQGAYDDAQTHVDALLDLADRWSDQRIRGHAHAHQAALHYDRGHPLDDVVAAATAAETLLGRLEGGSEYPLLAAYHAHIGALLRRADWAEANDVLDEAESAVAAYPAGRAHLQTLRARLLLRRGDAPAAETLMETLFEHVHHLPYGLQRSHVALLRGELLARRTAYDAAQTWLERAYRNARETGHCGNQLRTLLTLASVLIQRGHRAEAAERLSEAEAYDDYFDVLPFALRRFVVLGEAARADGRFDDARSAYVQARSAATLIQDTPATEHARRMLAELDADDRPRPAPSDDEAASSFESTIGAALARASRSVELIAEAWIQGIERLMTDRWWIGVFRHAPGEGWTRIHAHGPRPAFLSFPDPEASRTAVLSLDGESPENEVPQGYASEDEAPQGDAPEGSGRDDGSVRWMRLRGPSAPQFFLGVSSPSDDEWAALRRRLAPWQPVFRLALERARSQHRRRPASPSRPPTPASIPLDGFVSESPPMADLARHIRRIHQSHSPVLIRGESGTGKSLVARAVHVTSERSDGPFQHVRCANMQQDPVEARLFGRVDDDGSLTPGAFHQCTGGTLLLEEVGTLPAPTQAALVRVLDSHEIVPQGATDAHPVDVRLLATAGPSLASQARTGSFREDLYHRLNVIPVQVPPLRQRREDLPLLVRHFLSRLGPRDMPAASITNRALEVLLEYDWPGNVRQLRNELERALTFVSSEPAPTIDLDLLSDSVVDGARPAAATGPASDDLDAIFHPDRSLNDLLGQTEKQVIEHVLRDHEGNVTASADVLGLTRQGLYKKMKRLDIDASAFQADAPTTAVPGGP